MLRIFLAFTIFCCSIFFANINANDIKTESIVKLSPREEGRQLMAKLVQKFKNDHNAYKLKEAETRKIYLDEFLKCLGWDAVNIHRATLYEQDTIPEARLFLSETTRFIDYKQRVDDKVFMLEAKRVNVNCDDPKYIFQAKRYCWSSMKSEVVIVSNFRQFRVYDVRKKPIFDNPYQGNIEIFNLNFEDYIAKFDLLYDTFSKENVEKGSIKKMLQAENPNLSRNLPDKELIKEITQLRLKLATDILQHNPKLDIADLNEATHNILNKILFCRILEDRDIEPTRLLELKVAHYFGDELLGGTQAVKKPNVASLHEFIVDEFTNRMQKRYRGIIFKPHASDNLKISDEVLKDIILSFYPPKCAFDFSTLPVDVIGHVYESYLGRRIFVKNGKVELEATPSVRETGGVFYSPNNIANFLVERTLKDITLDKNIDDLMALKIIDPASGSGALLIQSAKLLFAEARVFYAKNPHLIGNNNSEFPDAIIDKNDRVKLSPFIKAKLVENCIYGVDIDRQANEIAAMWLYMLILENENFSVVDMERKAKIPNRSFKDKQSFALPDLSENLVCGNALIDDKTVDLQAFNWHENNTKIGKIMQSGGFDAVVGNPPYIGYLSMNRLIPNQLQYLRKNYESMSYMQGDMAFAFVEKGTQLLNQNGVLGYILTNRFMFNQAGLPLRKILSKNEYLREIINFGNARVFPEASVYTALLFLSKQPNSNVKYANLLNDRKLDLMLENINLEDDNDDFYVTSIPQAKLSDGTYSIPAPRHQEFISIMNQSQTTLKDVAKTISRIKAGNNDIFFVQIVKEHNNLLFVKSKVANNGFGIEKDIVKLGKRTTKMNNYSNTITNQAVIYPYSKHGLIIEKDLQKYYPLAYSYLISHKDSRFIQKNH